jgi:hypothetical protein
VFGGVILLTVGAGALSWSHLTHIGGVWLVEAREGGADGKSRWFELPNEDLALDCVRDLISASDFGDWRELPSG